jgi:hypothetical protein
MMRPVSIKLAVVVPVVFVTWYFTSSITAQFALKPFQGAYKSGQAILSTPTPSAKTVPAAQAKYQLGGFDVTTDGQAARVSASVNMYSQSNDHDYMWRLRVYPDGQELPGIDKAYEDQIFEIHPSGRMTPTFDESIPLPVGKYRITLSLYAMPKGYDRTQLVDGSNEKSVTIIRVAGKIVIQ